jgi:hypothetical protein
MRISNLRIPELRGKALDYLGQFVPRSRDNYAAIENTINQTDGEKADKAGVWQGVVGAFDHEVELNVGTGLRTIVSAPPALTAKIVSGITISTGGGSTVTLCIQDGANTYEFYTPAPLGFLGRATYPHTLVLRPGCYITATTGAVTNVTTHAALVPYGPDASGNMPDASVAHSRYDCAVGEFIGTGVNQVILDAPPAGTKRIVRTVTFANGFASPATWFGIEKISTTTTYNIRIYAISPNRSSLWSVLDDCALVLDSDSRLVITHNIDPGIFDVTAHYLDTASAESRL